MNSLRAPLAWLLFAGVSGLAQNPIPPSAPALDVLPLTPPAEARRTAGELEQLLAPIALYPDALIALILPASTAPTDIVLAARYVREAGNDRSQVEHRAWDESVKSLTYYPELLKWMDENLQWTKQVGEAFAEQPAEVMQAVQRLRAKARAAGTLVDTPQQQVLTDPDVIRIVPAQANVIYVPYYDPAYVFVDRPVTFGQPFLTFGIGLPVGSWLAFDCDWRRHTIWVGNRHRHWTGQDWHRPVVPIPVVAPVYATLPGVRPWRPPTPPGHSRPPLPYRASTEIVRSAPGTSPVTRSFASPPLAYRQPGIPVQPRRSVPAPGPIRFAQPSSPPIQAPPLVMAPFRTVPAGSVANTPDPATPATSPRRGPPERQSTQGTPTYSQQRHANPTPRPSQAAPPAGTVAPPGYSSRAGPAAAPVYSRSAPPAAGGNVQPAPPARTRSQPAPAPAPAPAAVTSTPTARAEVDTDRGGSRRNPYER